MKHKIAMNVVRGVLAAVFGTWFAMSFLSQDPTRKWDKVRKKFDPSGAFVPDFRFFAPNPGVHDYHVLVRDELPDGSTTNWAELGGPHTRKLHHSIWFTGRRAEKVVLDSVSGILEYTNDKENTPEGVQLTIPYLTILNHVTHQAPHHPDAKRTQFLICSSDGYYEEEEPNMIFLSNLHPLP